MNQNIVKKELLGSGGMADVFLAYHKGLDKNVAVKILKRDVLKDIEYVKRFFREARITANLNHPNILKIFESNVHNGEYYIVTEYMGGGDFSLIVNNHKVGLKIKLKIISMVLKALNFAHQKGVVHRDVKPSNILLGKDYSVRLGDFGIATALWGQESKLTATNELIGTMDYIAPEQRESAKRVDGRADIYSIGVILYSMITGRKPQGAFLKPSEIITSLPDALDNLIMKCLNPRPADRYKSCFNLYKELDDIIEASGDDEILLTARPYHMNPVTEIRQTTVIDTVGLDKLLKLLRTGSISEKSEAREMLLARYASADKERVLELLDSEEGFCLETIIELVGKLELTSAGKKIMRFLDDPGLMKMAARVIGEIGYIDAEDKLIEILKRGGPSGSVAIEPLGRIKSEKSVKFIQPYMNSEFDWIKESAIDALFRIGGKKSDTILRKSASNDSSADIRGKIKRLMLEAGRKL